jgi:hypothetical protein
MGAGHRRGWGPAQGVHGGQQVGVGELGGIQVRALVRGKQAAQAGSPSVAGPGPGRGRRF